MATIQVPAIPHTITAGSTNVTEVQFPELEGLGDGLVLKITTVSSTNGIYFNTIGDADESNYLLTQDTSTYLTLIPGRNLSYKADGASDTFRIEA